MAQKLMSNVFLKTLHLVIIIGIGIGIMIFTALVLLVPENMTQPHPMAYLQNDTGMVILKNNLYYFMTPKYTDNAYYNPVQISFHDVVFTLFPVGFRGGLPIPCNTQGTEQYYWVDVKFTDATHELLHIQVDSPPCIANPIPSKFSNHTNPQAGLVSYNGTMKLLVSIGSINSK
jgi:hypothetical protein